MLVLTRRLGERISIGGAVQVEILLVRRGQVRLGVVAPRDMRILRETHSEVRRKVAR